MYVCVCLSGSQHHHNHNDVISSNNNKHLLTPSHPHPHTPTHTHPTHTQGSTASRACRSGTRARRSTASSRRVGRPRSTTACVLSVSQAVCLSVTACCLTVRLFQLDRTRLDRFASRWPLSTHPNLCLLIDRSAPLVCTIHRSISHSLTPSTPPRHQSRPKRKRRTL